MTEHTFAVPVYGWAASLPALIGSLRAQRGTASGILLATSTPCAQLERFAREEGLPLHVNPQRLGIAEDWNFALTAAASELVTLAHQDDWYAPGYALTLREALERHPRALLAYCDYTEHTPRGPRGSHANLWVKRALSARAFRGRECIGSPREKRGLLAFGNPICCPSVMLRRSLVPDFRFPEGFRTNLDWMAWLALARHAGGFVYVRERLLSKGVHAGSETTATLANRARQREDRQIFETLWPRPIAAALMLPYRLGYLANRAGRSAVTEPHAEEPRGDDHDPDPLQR